MARRKRWARCRLPKRFWVYAPLTIISLYILLLPSGRSFETVNPNETNLMLSRRAEAARRGRELSMQWRWVARKRIPIHVVKAILAGEDSRFFFHHGIEFGEVSRVLWRALGNLEFPRGASTISQQLAKNLYLSESKNIFRKMSEAIIALKMELFLSKARILEIYLNVIEWGDGIFGIEAASQHYFGVSVNSLTLEQACLLAAMIPNPRTTFNFERNQRRVTVRAAHLMKALNTIQLPPGSW